MKKQKEGSIKGKRWTERRVSCFSRFRERKEIHSEECNSKVRVTKS